MFLARFDNESGPGSNLPSALASLFPPKGSELLEKEDHTASSFFDCTPNVNHDAHPRHHTLVASTVKARGNSVGTLLHLLKGKDGLDAGY